MLGVRPLEVLERFGVEHELFGDYHLRKTPIRVWMRTPRRKDITSFGTFFSTLCHELCQHLDILRLGFPSTLHAIGFYERVLYCHALGRPRRKLPWIPIGERWTIDWPTYHRQR